MGMGVRVPQLVFPINVPTFDCTEIAYIQNLGGGLAKYFFAGWCPVPNAHPVHTQRVVKLGIIFPNSGVPRAAATALSAVASFALLTPEDFIGEPLGHG
jgi:hypothetical protein